jgi:hypothetical protein
MSSCVIKKSDAFCSKFQGINLTMSPSNGPTLEISLIGDPETGIQQHKELASTALKEVEEFGLNFGNSESWELVSIQTAKSSSGVITTCTFIDSVWLKFNSFFVAPGDSYNGAESFADLLLGREWFNVTGTTSGYLDGRQRDVLVERSFLWGHKGSRYHKINNGYGYVRVDGSIVTRNWKSVSFDNVSGINGYSRDSYKKNHTPGIPHPYVEYGSFYYSFNAGTSIVKAGERGLKREIEEFLKNNAGLNIEIENAEGFTGLFNDAGTFADVLSGIGNAFGKSFTSNSFWGAKYFDFTEISGKIEAMEDEGITVPDNAISSSIETDYSLAVSHSYQKLSRRPGRYPRETDYDIEDEAPAYNDSGSFRAVPKLRFISDDVDLSSSLSAGDEADDKELAWYLIGDHPVFQELGVAVVCSEAEEIDGDWARTVYGMDGTYYKNVNDKLKGADFLERARQELGVSGTAEDSHVCAYQNTDRIWYSSTIDGKDITAQGDTDGESAMFGNLQSAGFENFGTADSPLGSRSWVTTSGGSLMFVPGTADIESLGVACSADKGTTVGDQIGIGGNDDEYNFTQGVVAIDYGPLPMPTIDASDVNYLGLETKIDTSPSVRAEEGERFNGVACVNKTELKQVAQDFLNTAVDAIQSQKERRASGGTAHYSGTKQTGVYYERANVGSDGRRQPWDQSDPEIQRSRMAAQPIVYRKSSWTGCKTNWKQGEEPPSDAWLLNRGTKHTKIDYSWMEDQNQNSFVRVNQDSEYLIQQYNYECGDAVYGVPYIQKMSFSLVNEMLEITPDNLKYVDSMSINVVDGKLTASYVFSEKAKLRDYRKFTTSRIKNLLNR